MNVAQKLIINTVQNCNVDMKRSKPFYPHIDETKKKLGYKVFVLNRDNAFATYKDKTEEITKDNAIKHIGKRVRAVKKAWETTLKIEGKVNLIIRYLPKDKKYPMKFFFIENFDGISNKEERMHRFSFVDNNEVVCSFSGKRPMKKHCGELKEMLVEYFEYWGIC